MRHQKKRYTVPRSKYAKIPLKTKLKFLKKIINEGYSIRDVKNFLNSLLPSTTSTTPLPRLSWGNIGPIISNSTLMAPLKRKFLSGMAIRREFVAVIAPSRPKRKPSMNSPRWVIIQETHFLFKTGFLPRFFLTQKKLKQKSNLTKRASLSRLR